jgi:hypothetical protein
MTILAETVDAIIGGDTHRDTHSLEMCSPTGATITTVDIANTDGGFADALAWVNQHAPGPASTDAPGPSARGEYASTLDLTDVCATSPSTRLLSDALDDHVGGRWRHWG